MFPPMLLGLRLHVVKVAPPVDQLGRIQGAGVEIGAADGLLKPLTGLFRQREGGRWEVSWECQSEKLSEDLMHQVTV